MPTRRHCAVSVHRDCAGMRATELTCCGQLQLSEAEHRDQLEVQRATSKLNSGWSMTSSMYCTQWAPGYWLSWSRPTRPH
jgi:hypothetical protein